MLEGKGSWAIPCPCPVTVIDRPRAHSFIHSLIHSLVRLCFVPSPGRARKSLESADAAASWATALKSAPTNPAVAFAIAFMSSPDSRRNLVLTCANWKKNPVQHGSRCYCYCYYGISSEQEKHKRTLTCIKIANLAFSSGMPIKTSRSNRPALRSAGSIASARLVACVLVCFGHIIKTAKHEHISLCHTAD